MKIGKKKCTVCGKVKAPDGFSTGHNPCKACRAVGGKRSWETCPEKREKRVERSRLWRQAHPKEAAEQHRAWREAHPEYLRRWKKANPEKVLEYRREYRERKMASVKAEMLKQDANEHDSGSIVVSKAVRIPKKACISCGRTKAVTEFHTGRNQCNACRLAYLRKYRADHERGPRRQK